LLRIVLLSGLLSACAPNQVELEFVSPELVFSAIDGGFSGAPTLLVGGVADGRFSSFEDGAELPILHGFQGGRWIHVALRVTGMRNRGRAEMRVTGIGHASYDIKLIRRGDLLEVFDLPIPVGRNPRLTDDEVDALAGQTAELEVSYTVGQTSLSQSFEMQLALGEH
jgi:hypothetical protein